ncbi:polysaccharide deacetylase family sporulation protein PdaB [Virgibacillus sp. 179-BFC.A HS]|uniref:Polysaccharide deacetylase family sporulation protein PdaB n=1 Tax=Tigheibacillus jepli TaxID=3035914 RepID=A0ABU5CLK0_9BACI|nr:polysaccharide deacetylase family sporulation protein PdaB [Virgibacillus sp. 179-BFC.A HS]MDY0407237.1 polysaccharide deacetylase family sporulation protein PdaB [Virgibacillus sp. 179-BFC.A HS]
MGNGFYVFRFSKKKRVITVVCIAFIAALFLWFGKSEVLSVFSKQNPSVLARGNEKVPNISLTFNISWGENKVHEILDQLEKNDVKATFFLSGEWAERHQEIIEEIMKGKHEIGMLGYRYKSYLDQDVEQVRADLLKAQEVFQKLGLKNVNLLRTPSGHFNEEIVELAHKLGFEVIHWNINPNDWKNPGTQEIIDFTMKNTSNGDILLLHASDSAKQTAEALKTILPGLKNKGFHFVHISELLTEAHTKAKLAD